MKANELRIGNLVYNHVAQYQIIDGEDIDDQINHNCFQPIPLTEEWLLKFGFSKPENFEKNYCKYGFRISPELMFSVGHFAFMVKYVHQLQNLYFALTGNELTTI